VYQRVAKFIREHKLFVQDLPIIVGVSGGADSLCLLDCLSQLGYSLVVAHLDHQLRPESADEVVLVREVSERYGVPFTSSSISLAEGDEAAGSLEERARLARYQYLLDVALVNEAQGVAVGHTLDDQVETVLMHFLRGAGPDGLSGMRSKTRFSDWVGIQSPRSMDLMRPLLALTHKETRQHCAGIGIDPIEDPSNLDDTFFRNRIRNELLPDLETYNPGIREVVSRLSEVMQEQVKFNDAELEAAWPKIVLEQAEAGIILDQAAILDLHPFLRRLLLRRAMAILAPQLRDISHAATLRAEAWFDDQDRPASLILPGGLSLERYADDALLRYPGRTIEFPRYPLLNDLKAVQLDVPCVLSLASGWSLVVDYSQYSSEAVQACLKDRSHRSAVFPAQISKEALILRPRRPGDRIQLPGVEGRTKISDLMINHKVPVQVRRLWPLVATQNEVLWVPFVQRSSMQLVYPEDTDVIIMGVQSPQDDSPQNPLT
jgi:tRNA(Ile)-lysidine synthase